MLHGIREGVLGYDKNERIVLANDFAQQLLDLPPDFVGRPLRQVLPPGRLADVVTGEIEGSDLLVLHGDRVLVANRMPIRHERRHHLGWVVTFQDRTESEALKRQLDDAIGLTETLRAQSHEFANRLHTLVGLVELGRYSEAIQFVTDVSAARADLTERLQADIENAKLVGADPGQGLAGGRTRRPAARHGRQPCRRPDQRRQRGADRRGEPHRQRDRRRGPGRRGRAGWS